MGLSASNVPNQPPQITSALQPRAHLGGRCAWALLDTAPESKWTDREKPIAAAIAPYPNEFWRVAQS
ncbi:hypothetical protein [Stenomitos frigidus]|uniref:hypothetical protein n=1 Tax=Stenomitos frigidus TaxID=1886765 RepID=UPI0011B21F7B|nr:hypothetical protein [Stenomitos frigidus]